MLAEAEGSGRLAICDWDIDPLAPDITDSPLLNSARQELGEYFAGKIREFSIPLIFPWATPFQQRVLDALRHIPYGETVTYSDVAKEIGQPTAVRAVASAIATNLLSIFVPCHRVVPTSNPPGKYRGGAEAKRILLELEQQYRET